MQCILYMHGRWNFAFSDRCFDWGWDRALGTIQDLVFRCLVGFLYCSMSFLCCSPVPAESWIVPSQRSSSNSNCQPEDRPSLGKSGR